MITSSIVWDALNLVCGYLEGPVSDELAEVLAMLEKVQVKRGKVELYRAIQILRELQQDREYLAQQLAGAINVFGPDGIETPMAGIERPDLAAAALN